MPANGDIKTPRTPSWESESNYAPRNNSNERAPEKLSVEEQLRIQTEYAAQLRNYIERYIPYANRTDDKELQEARKQIKELKNYINTMNKTKVSKDFMKKRNAVQKSLASLPSKRRFLKHKEVELLRQGFTRSNMEREMKETRERVLGQANASTSSNMPYMERANTKRQNASTSMMPPMNKPRRNTGTGTTPNFTHAYVEQPKVQRRPRRIGKWDLKARMRNITRQLDGLEFSREPMDYELTGKKKKWRPGNLAIFKRRRRV